MGLKLGQSYDIVIATRNRQDALRLSVPLMLSQSRPPEWLIVVDSSDDFNATRRVVDDFRSQNIILLRSERGSSLQRNIGLQHVKSPVVMFPDDDSIWFPDTAEAIMRVYERDVDGLIGAVCAAESPVPPPGFQNTSTTAYRMTRGDRIKQRVAHIRAAVERRFFPDPFYIHGRSHCDTAPQSPWFDEEDVVLVEWMTGFRMSFRSDVIRRFGFDETLRHYGLYEDVDASFQAMRSHLIVGARRAKVYHYRAPGARADSLSMGIQPILNRAYVIAKHSSSLSPARRYVVRYGWYKLALYSLACHTRHGRRRWLGAWRAQRRVKELLRTDPTSLQERYLALRDRCLNN